MRLKHIKLSGFKSFVDPTTVAMPANLVGVVGPNGCGKSNIIDAVRWVMGESSAKTLRGDNMADVIFNGSTARKPVGRAMVELVFDNGEGKAPGIYAKYSEIAIRRELTRDGQSGYFINRTRCRRRDITDIFLGTGLGPRSYSIIEQGMVSRIIEARPDELRVLIEEAAGISKYKDRRRETETRIRHTRENLSRVEDIRAELETQLRRLKRQSAAAARYKTLKAEERGLKAQVLALRWRRLDAELKQFDAQVARAQTELEAKVADVRGVENVIERLRREQAEANEALNAVQGEFYSIGARVSNVEQNIEHARETRTQYETELERLDDSEREAQGHLDGDRTEIGRLERELETATTRRAQSAEDFERCLETLRAAESAYLDWQNAWEEFGHDAAKSEQEGEIQRARIAEHERQTSQIEDRRRRIVDQARNIESELEDLRPQALSSEVKDVDDRFAALQDEIAALEREVHDVRADIGERETMWETARDAHTDNEAKLKALRELQAAALGADDDRLQGWLVGNGIQDAPRLNAVLEVEPGWEAAVDRVLGARSAAVCVDRLDDLARTAAQTLRDSAVTLVERTHSAAPSVDRLLDKVRCDDVDLSPWLGRVYAVDTLAQALARRDRLATDESVVTRDGLWFGRHWLATGGDGDVRAGILERAAEIEALATVVDQGAAHIVALRDALQRVRRQLDGTEQKLVDRRRAFAALSTARTDLHNRLGALEARAEALNAQRARGQEDLAELDREAAALAQALDGARTRLSTAEAMNAGHQSRRSELSSTRDVLRAALDDARTDADTARDAKHQAEFDCERLSAAITATRERIDRLSRQTSGMAARRQELRALLATDDRPETDLQQELETLLESRIGVEKNLARTRARVAEIDEALRSNESARVAREQQAREVRDRIGELQVARGEAAVRRDTLYEQIQDGGYRAEDVLAELPDDVDEAQSSEQLATVTQRIERIGPVNLVAIEEYEEQSERKVYLDKQHEDLNEALATLEGVIQKIDRETRSRFKQTFENLDRRFQEFFPKLFGGGSAYLELTGTDLLDTGVAVMARPPGKRNSTIHLLSGGEKALTAVSLMFAFFDLNPAPFCMLDEVDAPLDDANVERYSSVLSTLAAKTQLIFITHNKITMEAADILVGVTMAEPGVSRLVAVDVDEAMEMAVQ